MTKYHPSLRDPSVNLTIPTPYSGMVKLDIDRYVSLGRLEEKLDQMEELKKMGIFKNKKSKK